MLQSDDREESAREEGGGDQGLDQQGLAVDAELPPSWKVVWAGCCDEGEAEGGGDGEYFCLSRQGLQFLTAVLQ